MLPDTQHASDRAPFGLGWTRRLIPRRRGDRLTLRELYVRRLAGGLLGASLALCGVSSVVFFASGSSVGAAIFLGNAALFGVWSALLLRSVLPFPVLVHAVMGHVLLVVAGLTLVTGGLGPSGFDPIWLVLAPMLAMLLLGRRAAVLWAIGGALTLGALLAWRSLGLPVGARPPDMPSLIAFNLASFCVFLLVALVWFVEQRDLAEAVLDRLLVNLLPASIAERLKHGELVADHHPAISILFADLVGFTPMSAELSPRSLMRILDGLFRELDAAVARHGLEKIKTIGDCYMVAAGVPTARGDHAQVLARFALEIRALVTSRTFEGRRLSLRLGMHTGPVIAGVIGEQRLLYDLWGDTVNVASRMESSGEPGRILVTESMADLLRDDFELEERGVVEVKGRGPMRCWWVVGERRAVCHRTVSVRG